MIKMHTYVMTHTADNGKETILETPLGGDADARLLICAEN